MVPDLTKKELAEAAGLTYRRLYDINIGLPDSQKFFVEREGSSKCDTALFVQRWVKYNVNKLRRDDEADDLNTAKTKHEKVKMQKTEIQVARLRGELIDVQDAKKLWGTVANTVTQNMLHLGSTLAPQLQMMDNVEVIRSIIDESVRKLLEEIAETPLPEYIEEEEEEGDDE